MDLLEFEKEIFTESFVNDGLLVMAKGMRVDRILLSFIKLYSEPTNLVVVLNTSTFEEEMILRELGEDKVGTMPQVINSSVGIAERERTYKGGGVKLVTNRIAIVDLLVGRLPAAMVTGIIVYHAHRVATSCQESFILRLYRQQNKKGFIKAMTASPVQTSKGFHDMQRLLKQLHVANVFLWPRFRGAVVECFDKRKMEATELHVEMTKAMKECQSCLVDLIDACVTELKRNNVLLDAEEINVEQALMSSFDRLLKAHLEPCWHRLSSKTKQLAADLRLLRSLLEELVQCDCVHFYNQMKRFKCDEVTINTNVGWLFTPAADRLLAIAGSRVSKGGGVEESPKWVVLQEVLQEVLQQFVTSLASSSLPPSSPSSPQPSPTLKPSSSPPSSSPPPSSLRSDDKLVVLVLALNDSICQQLMQFVSNKDSFMRSLKEKLKFKFAKTTGDSSKDTFPNTRNPAANSYNKSTTNQSTTNQSNTNQSTTNQSTTNQSTTNQSTTPQSSTSSSTTTTYKDHLLLHFRALKGIDNHHLPYHLSTLKPHVIILYDSVLTAVRQIEVYKLYEGRTRVYSLVYTGSTEEQVFLSTLKVEKQAFEKLIKQKATLVVSVDRGLDEEVQDLTNEDTRKGGQSNQVIQSKVVVDMREFRSELPSLLHKKSVGVDPVTLEVGDYILTPDICVERKSVSDLIGSLGNGRLFNQCLSMTRTYKRPVLLIEFSAGKPFALQDKQPIRNEISSSDVISRLSLLILHFHQLRILWTQSPYDTAELFVEIKEGREQPSSADAAMVTGASEEEGSVPEDINHKYNSTPFDMLSKMPGVTARNIHCILHRVSSMAELVAMPLEGLQDLLGNSTNSKKLFDFIHHKGRAGEAGKKGGGREGFEGGAVGIGKKRKRFQLKTVGK